MLKRTGKYAKISILDKFPYVQYAVYFKGGYYIMQNAAQAKFVLEHLDEMFPVVRASELRLDDEFMHHTPVGWIQERVMKTLLSQIPLGIGDFRRPRMDPSVDDEGNIFFKEGERPGAGKLLAFEWKAKFKAFLPEKNSQIETDIGYDIFCGAYIKELVAKGCNVGRAWYEVCNESGKHGHFWDSPGARDAFELTGSRTQGVWSDLGNTKKIITNEEGTDFFVVSGSYKNSGSQYPMANKEELRYSEDMKFSIGLMRMDV